MADTLKYIIESLADTIDKTTLKISDECLFQEACKFLRTPGQSWHVPNKPRKIEPATKKQKDFIYGLGLDVNTEKLTKQEAIIVIKQAKEKSK